MKGRVHSYETFGTVDGPGIRFVLFMQGCALRCQYCHNSDSWDMTGGRHFKVDQILAEIEPYLPFYRNSGGGITVSGGEPTLQAPFVAELFKACKERFGLHTVLDSSGFCDAAHVSGLLGDTDLVLLDLKQINNVRHMALTGQPNERILTFAERLCALKKPVWIRHVLVPGVTDAYEDLFALGEYIGRLSNVQKFELLPYHRMGVYKWHQLGRTYPLEGVPVPTDREIERAKQIIETARRNVLINL